TQQQQNSADFAAVSNTAK
ncbi:hypothetical protein DOY81_010076, partial [Sarcophaga bullata]